MIVDACTRIWQGAEPWAARMGYVPASSQDLRIAMTGAGAAFVLGYRADRQDASVPTERVLAWVHESPNERIGFAGIDPLSDSAMEDLASAREQGIAGVTIAPADAGCRPTDDRCRVVLEWCAHHRMPVIISNPGLLSAQSVLEYADPALFDEVLRENPELRLVFGDVGYAYGDMALAMIAKHAGAFVEVSTVARQPNALYHTLVSAHERTVLSKLLFASGFPAETPQRTIERIFSVNGFSPASVGWSAIPREQLRAMVERDSIQLLGIDPLPVEVTQKLKREGLRRSVRPLELGTTS